MSAPADSNHNDFTNNSTDASMPSSALLQEVPLLSSANRNHHAQAVQQGGANGAPVPGSSLDAAPMEIDPAPVVAVGGSTLASSAAAPRATSESAPPPSAASQEQRPGPVIVAPALPAQPGDAAAMVDVLVAVPGKVAATAVSLAPADFDMNQPTPAAAGSAAHIVEISGAALQLQARAPVIASSLSLSPEAPAVVLESRPDYGRLIAHSAVSSVHVSDDETWHVVSVSAKDHQCFARAYQCIFPEHVIDVEQLGKDALEVIKARFDHDLQVRNAVTLMLELEGKTTEMTDDLLERLGRHLCPGASRADGTGQLWLGSTTACLLAYLPAYSNVCVYAINLDPAKRAVSCITNPPQATQCAFVLYDKSHYHVLLRASRAAANGRTTTPLFPLQCAEGVRDKMFAFHVSKQLGLDPACEDEKFDDGDVSVIAGKAVAPASARVLCPGIGGAMAAAVSSSTTKPPARHVELQSSELLANLYARMEAQIEKANITAGHPRVSKIAGGTLQILLRDIDGCAGLEEEHLASVREGAIRSGQYTLEQARKMHITPTQVLLSLPGATRQPLHRDRPQGAQARNTSSFLTAVSLNCASPYFLKPSVPVPAEPRYDGRKKLLNRDELHASHEAGCWDLALSYESKVVVQGTAFLFRQDLPHAGPGNSTDNADELRVVLFNELSLYVNPRPASTVQVFVWMETADAYGIESREAAQSVYAHRKDDSIGRFDDPTDRRNCVRNLFRWGYLRSYDAKLAKAGKIDWISTADVLLDQPLTEDEINTRMKASMSVSSSTVPLRLPRRAAAAAAAAAAAIAPAAVAAASSSTRVLRESREEQEYIFERFTKVCLKSGRVQVLWRGGQKTYEPIQNLREDLGDANFEDLARISALPLQKQQEALAARENATTRLSRRRAVQDVGGDDAVELCERCSYCPSRTPSPWQCVGDGCSQTICSNCIRHVSTLLSPDEQRKLLSGSVFRCVQHGGSIAIPAHPLYTLYSGGGDGGASHRVLRIGVYTLARDPHHWREVVEAAGCVYVQLEWASPPDASMSDVVILDYHTDSVTGHAQVHETGQVVTQVQMLSRFITSGTKVVVPLTCGGYRRQMREIEQASLELYPQVQFLLYGMSRMSIDALLKHLVVQVLKDTQLHGLTTLEHAVKVHFLSELARVYEPALLQGGRLGGAAIYQPGLVPTTLESRDDAQMMEDDASSHHDDTALSYQAIRHPRGRRVGPRLPGGHPYNAVGSQLSHVERLSPASATERVHFKVLEKLPVDSLGFYLQAQVVTVGKCLLAFTCRGIAGPESYDEWRKRSKHIDGQLKKEGRVQLHTVHRDDAEHLVGLIGLNSQLRDGTIVLPSRKVFILERLEENNGATELQQPAAASSML